MSEIFTTLGYENNSLIHEYRVKQFESLLLTLKQQFSDEEMVNNLLELPIEEQKEFLFHPDQASILSCLSFIENPDVFKKKFLEELKKYLNGDLKNMIAYSGVKIEGTELYLTVQDNNPLNSIDIHPDGGGGVGWGEKTPEQWKQVYDNTFRLLKQADKGFHSELCQMLRKIVAYGTAKQIHYSASYKECVGTLYMGYTLDTDIAELHVLEGLVHESSHNKLNLIMQFEDITLNDFTEKYYSPYRPDARHLYGVFLGIHALTPTVYVLLQAVNKGLVTDNRWLEKIALYHVKNKLGIVTVKKFGILSQMGQRVFDDICEVAKISDPLVKQMIQNYNLPIQAIQRKAKEHFLEVNKNYPHMVY